MQVFFNEVLSFDEWWSWTPQITVLSEIVFLQNVTWGQKTQYILKNSFITAAILVRDLLESGKWQLLAEVEYTENLWCWKYTAHFL